MAKHDEPFYRRIISDAWHIAWHHKHLWVFGFFATLVGFGAVTEPLFGLSDRAFEMLPGMMGGQGAAAIPGFATFRAVTLSSAYPLLSFMISLIILAFFGAVFAWMTFVSVGALIGSVRKIERGGDPKFADEVKLGTQKVWPVFGVNVMVKIFLLALVTLTATSLRQLLAEGGITRGLFYIGGFTVFTLLAVFASVVAVFATCEVVTKNRKARESIDAGIALVAAHWLSSLELAFALMVTTIVVGLGAAAVAIIGSIPFIFMIMVAAVIQAPIASTLAVTTAIAVAIGLIVTVGSFLTAFQVAAWTLFWGDVETKKHAPPKIIRLAKKHLPWMA